MLSTYTRPKKQRLSLRLFLLVVVVLILVACQWVGAAGSELPATLDGKAFLYTVQKGDTLFALSRRWGVSLTELMKVNGILDPSRLMVGQVLVIPVRQQGAGKGSDSRTERSAGSQETSVKPGKMLTVDVPPGSLVVTPEEIELLARLVHAEARGEPYEGMLAVAAVVVNRVKHPGFPKTIREVIYQPGQFKCVENGTINTSPDPLCVKAAKEALAGRDPTHGALFFYNPQTSTALAFWNTRQVVAVIGRHTFAR